MTTIPDDIFLEIFSIYTSYHGLYQSPANLLRISKRIHALVVASSPLWSSIKIYMHSASEVQQAMASTGLEAYLQRSERVPGTSVPLDISISWPTSDPYDSMEHEMLYTLTCLGSRRPPCHQMSSLQVSFQKLMWTLGGRPENSPWSGPYRQLRWRSLKINSRAYQTLHISLMLPVYTDRHSIPNLEMLECRGIKTTIASSIAPKLKHFSLRWTTGLTPLKMPKVERLTIEDDSEVVMLEWCRRLPNLKTIEVFQGYLPAPRFVPRLSTVILHSGISFEQFYALNQYSVYRPLDTLILYDFSPDTVVGYLSKTFQLRFRRLKLMTKNPWMFRLPFMEKGRWAAFSPIGVSFAEVILKDVTDRGATLEILENP
ncbi:hypothetical protein FRC19_010204 [Serendipita sp. 401]|nr:hypothetical protein FRC19_010204 [Serendipita sp. 401]